MTQMARKLTSRQYFLLSIELMVLDFDSRIQSRWVFSYTKDCLANSQTLYFKINESTRFYSDLTLNSELIKKCQCFIEQTPRKLTRSFGSALLREFSATNSHVFENLIRVRILTAVQFFHQRGVCLIA